MKYQKNIVFNMNSKYFPYSLVMLQSLFKNNPLYNFCIYLLYSDMEFWELEYIEKFINWNQSNFISIKVDKKKFQEFPLNARWSVETYYRLLIPELLPNEIMQVVYLDIDLIIDGDISDLFQLDLDSYYLAACEDLYENIDYHSLNRKWNRLDEIKYFNAGVMVLNLCEIRKKVQFNDYGRVVEAMKGELPYMDQDILNYLFGEKVQYLPAQFNNVVGVKTNKKQQGIIYHYGTPEKPWNTKKALVFQELWWKYANQVIDYKII